MEKFLSKMVFLKVKIHSNLSLAAWVYRIYRIEFSVYNGRYAKGKLSYVAYDSLRLFVLIQLTPNQ